MQSAKDILTSSEKFHINLGLKRIKLVLALMDNPQNHFKTIHIAGTNGKGSTCKMITDILIEHFKDTDVKIGLFTSPHLFSYTERIKINNENIKEHVFDKLVKDINIFAKNNNIELTEFELITAVAFYYFYIKKVDYAIIEVGLGGKYDATNVINPIIEAITTIDFDHTAQLGNTIAKIALQKAGIIKEKSRVVVSKNNLGFDVIKKVIQNQNADLIEVDKEENYNINLLGEHQKENLAIALGVIKNIDLDIKEETIKNALEKVCWKFRLEYDKNKNLLIDGAHNPSGTTKLRNFLDKNFENEKKTFIFGCLKTKDYNKMLEILLKEEDEFIFYEFEYPNALKLEDLDEKYQKRAKKVTDLNEIKNILNEKQNLKVVCGSLYMLGNIFRDCF